MDDWPRFADRAFRSSSSLSGESSNRSIRAVKSSLGEESSSGETESPLALNSQAHQDPHLLQAEPASKHAARKTVPYEVASVEIKYPLRPPCSIACSITNMRTGARCFGLPI